ncbi:MAG: hypothetical protein B7O98_02920 [Zestosphaera tikiterensis]|uniref:Radical SAM core domain-containing protein n=1 Tax=Zestosphaera tikiterensis TaxID=1973259 RepID=A0A2R7Y782_9CREN|nr:MAG: hypothetical protein B7O98_02920 [Zestosphaera tikiterensis]
MEVRFRGLRIEEQPSKPSEVVVEVTTHCNYRCVHCFRNYMKPSEFSHMDLELYRRLLDQLEEAGIRNITFTGWGEPLVHPHILEILGEAKKRGFRVLLNTNGALLSDYVDDLVKMGVDGVVVSVDSADPELYGRLRVGGAFNEVLNGVLRLVEVSEKLGKSPIIAFWFTLASYNCHDVLNLPLFAAKFRITRVFISHIIPFTREHEEAYSCLYSPERQNKFRKMIEKAIYGSINIQFRQPVKIVLPPTILGYERSCPFAEARTTYVRFDGGVAPCIHYAHSWRFSFRGVERRVEPVVFGNISEEKLLEIWRSEFYTKFRIRAALALMPSCLNCELAPYCSYTYSNESDCWVNMPTCSHCPYLHGYSRCPLQYYLFERYV